MYKVVLSKRLATGGLNALLWWRRYAVARADECISKGDALRVFRGAAIRIGCRCALGGFDDSEEVRRRVCSQELDHQRNALRIGVADKLLKPADNRLSLGTDGGEQGSICRGLVLKPSEGSRQGGAGMGGQGELGEHALAGSQGEGGWGNRGHAVAGRSRCRAVGSSACHERRDGDELHVEREFTSTHCRSEGGKGKEWGNL